MREWLISLNIPAVACPYIMKTNHLLSPLRLIHLYFFLIFFLILYKCWENHAWVFWPLLTHRSQKNGSWVWNNSLPRDKVPAQPVRGLATCVGISCPVLYSMRVPMLSSLMCLSGSLTFSISDFMGEEEGSFYCSTRECV